VGKPLETCGGLVNVLRHPPLLFLAELPGGSVQRCRHPAELGGKEVLLIVEDGPALFLCGSGQTLRLLGEVLASLVHCGTGLGSIVGGRASGRCHWLACLGLGKLLP
jgi:hypothetical protein